MTPRRRHERAVQRRPDAGFGMISVLVAIVLISVGALSLSQVLTQSVSMQTIISMRTTGLDIARAAMENLKGQDPLTLVGQAPIRVNDKGEPDSGGAFTREITVESVAQHLIEVYVIVTTPRSNPIELMTWIYDGVY